MKKHPGRPRVMLACPLCVHKKMRAREWQSHVLKCARSVDPEKQLFVSVARWVSSLGGIVLVAGGIQLQKWSQDGPDNFTIAVKCTGRAPKKREPKEAAK